LHIEEQDTYSIVKRHIPEGQTTCSLCSQLRDGILYCVATELGATKIARGHHRDNILETLFLNLFYTESPRACTQSIEIDTFWFFSRGTGSDAQNTTQR